MAYAKAIVAALIALLTSFSQAMVDGSVTSQDWVQAAIAGLVALGAVYTVPNMRK